MSDNLFLQLIFAGTLLFVVFSFFLVYFFVIQRIKLNRHYMEKQQLLLELQNKELSVRFEERELMMTQVSKEVHDNIGQLAHLSRMHLYEIEAAAMDTYQLKLIKYVSELTDLLINETNHVSHSLNSDFIKSRGLIRALEDDLEQIKSSSNIACYLNIEGENRLLEPERKLLVYRIAQEVIHNALKHGAPTLLEVNLIYTANNFTMRIHDNGKGFDIEKVREKGTMGLSNMHERAKLLSGRLSIKSAEGRGCIVILVVESAFSTAPFKYTE